MYLALLNEIPHTQYDQYHSSEGKFKGTLVDFRFELLFRNDRDAYKKFLTSFLYGNGVYAEFQGHYIHITPTEIRRAPRPGPNDLILPDNWVKIAKIIKE